MQHLNNLVELYRWSCEQHADREILGTKKAGAWHWLTYRQFRNLIDEVRGGLASLGVRAGDRIAFIGDNSVEWAVAAYASYGLGAAFVPMYQAQRPSEWEFILADCSARVAICTNEPTYEVLDGMRARLPELRQLIGVARPDGAAGSWNDLRAIGATRPVDALSPEPDHIAGFIYTSGTTGKPLASPRSVSAWRCSAATAPGRQTSSPRSARPSHSPARSRWPRPSCTASGFPAMSASAATGRRDAGR